jgi:hypothetical protein
MIFYEVKGGYGGFALSQHTCEKNTHIRKRYEQTPLNPSPDVKLENQNPLPMTSLLHSGFEQVRYTSTFPKGWI